jgi:hypothetical protein
VPTSCNKAMLGSRNIEACRGFCAAPFYCGSTRRVVSSVLLVRVGVASNTRIRFPLRRPPSVLRIVCALLWYASFVWAATVNDDVAIISLSLLLLCGMSDDENVKATS